MEATQLITIGELSKRTGVNIETIRYYERVGILPKPHRSAGGHRLYPEEYRRRLVLLRHKLRRERFCFFAAQQGQRERLATSSMMSSRRSVAIELGT